MYIYYKEKEKKKKVKALLGLQTSGPCSHALLGCRLIKLGDKHPKTATLP